MLVLVELPLPPLGPRGPGEFSLEEKLQELRFASRKRISDLQLPGRSRTRTSRG
jgi:hypothetical protein